MRRVVIGLAGLITGAVLAAGIVVGEGQVKLAASGALGGLGGSGIFLVDPRWSTLVASALALLVLGTGILVWQLARGRTGRMFWLAAAVAPVTVVAIGTPIAETMAGSGPRATIDELLANGSHSPLLLTVILAALAAAWAPARPGQDSDRPAA